MIVFLLAAGLILAYGAVYMIFCIKKGGIAAALWVFLCWVLDLGLMILLVHFRTNT